MYSNNLGFELRNICKLYPFSKGVVFDTWERKAVNNNVIFNIRKELH